MRILRYLLSAIALTVGCYAAAPVVMPVFSGQLANGKIYQVWVDPEEDGGGTLRIVYSVTWNTDAYQLEEFAHAQADISGQAIPDKRLSPAARARIDHQIDQLSHPNALAARIFVDWHDGRPTNPRILPHFFLDDPWVAPTGILLIALGPLWWFSRRLRQAIAGSSERAAPGCVQPKHVPSQ